ncbi:MAG TPA: carboxypeptidase regulatory-like domain-containing protein [Planctomycetes bacterium]|nr:carboxypeptidase regulatory-like domain-containing protein [Planctomycetota bacterium]HIL37406.1 carboxypeptidase regulatory-like domain-containing protein [Planctomycetota bacterium]
MKHFLLPLLALLALVFAASLLFRSEEAPVLSDAAGSSSSEGPLQAPAQNGPVELSGEGDTAGQAAGRSPLNEASSEKDQNPVEGVAQVRLTGRIVDEQSKPVQGALITVREPRGRGMIFTPQLDSPPVSTTHTNLAGRFSIPTSGRGMREIRVKRDGFQFLTERAYLGATRDFNIGDLVLEAGFGLRGRVLSMDGEPLEGVSVSLLPPAVAGRMSFSFGARPGVEIASTDAGGNFVVSCLPLGPFELAAARDDLLRATQGGVMRRGGNEVLEIHAEYGAVLSGILKKNKLSLEEVKVVAWSQSSSMPQLKISGGMGGPTPFDQQREGQVLSDGSFVVRGLPHDTEVQVAVFSVDKSLVPLGPIAEAESDASDVVLDIFPSFDLKLSVVSAADSEVIKSFVAWAGFRRLEPLHDEEGQILRHHHGGRVTYPGLRLTSPQGRLTVQVNSPGFAPFSRGDLVPPASGVLDLGKIRLVRAPGLRIRVLDDRTGEPLVGVRVTAEEESHEPGAAPIGLLELAGEDGSFLSLGNKPLVVAHTNKEGEVQVAATPGERYRVSIQHEGYSDLTKTLQATVANILHEARLLRPCTVEVTLLDSQGEPKAAGRVEHRLKEMRTGMGITFDSRETGPRRTDSKGLAIFGDLKPGTHLFRAAGKDPAMGMIMVIKGQEPEQVSWTEVSLAAGETRTIALREEPKALVRGRVFLDGEPLAQCKVTFQPDGNEMFFMGAGGPGDLTAADGSFEIEGLNPGQGRLTFRHPDLVMRHEQEHTCTRGAQVVDVDLVLTTVSGRVTGPDGSELAGIRVSVGGGGKQVMGRMIMITASSEGSGQAISTFGGANSVLSADDGSYILRGVRSGISLEIKATGEGLKPASRTLEPLVPGELKQDFNLMLEVGASLILTRTPSEDQDFSMVRLEFLGSEPDSGPVQDEREIMFEGTCRFDGLTPGPWRIFLEAPGLSDSEPLIEPRDVELRPGEEGQISLD